MRIKFEELYFLSIITKLEINFNFVLELNFVKH